MMFDKTGTIVINTVTGSGALPVVNTVVRIIGNVEENRLIEYSLITDIDGVSEIIELPAPSKELSESPGSKEIPYATYDVEISAEGYYSKKIYNVSVFENVETILKVDMIPLSVRQNDITYPRDNLTTVVEENKYLESIYD